MPAFSRAAVALAMATGLHACGGQDTAPRDALTPGDVLAEADRLAGDTVWPGFDLASVPVAFYHDSVTWLYRHPAPPEGFEAVPGSTSAWRWPGRHPAVVANTSVELGGEQTATVLLDDAGGDVREIAGLLVHEAFHVFQRERHPDWVANEVSLFTYPVEDTAVVADARLELAALARAIETADETGRCWARVALDHRSGRFARLAADAVAYERGTELNEGLARYVEHRAMDAADRDLISTSFGPEEVRQRGYVTGLALALLLDRYDPDWKTTLAGMEAPALDPLLTEAVRSAGDDCGFDDARIAEAQQEAAEAVAGLVQERRARLDRFRSADGWTVEVRSPDQPLFPSGFDPLNVSVVGDGLVLHTRMVSLQNGAVTVDVVGTEALTGSAGSHPLFNGVRSITIAGLASEPAITEEAGRVSVRAEGVEITASAARVDREGQRVTVTVGGPDA